MAADTLSTVANGFGIVGFGTHAFHRLLEDIEAVRNAPDELAALAQELHSVEDVLRSVDSGSEGFPRDTTVLKKQIGFCQTNCDKLRSKLAGWTKRSEDGSLHILDRVAFAYFARGEVATLKTELQACKTNVTLATQGAMM
jgi:hypothetical protein